MRTNRSVVLAAFALVAACSEPQIVTRAPEEVTLKDNVHGGSHGRWALRPDGILSIEVNSVVGDCTLKDFLITPLDKTGESRQSTYRRQQPDTNDGTLATANILTNARTLEVQARYVHTVLVSSGTKTEPPRPAAKAGSGDDIVGPDTLVNDYHFDHADFSYTSEGPGGASAYVASESSKFGSSGHITVRWYYNEDSFVHYKWAIYATGPCGDSPL